MNAKFQFLLAIFLSTIGASVGFSIILMGRRKGGLKKSLESDGSVSNKASFNQGKGQEITGVTLPAPGAIKGWEFGEKQTMVCANVGGKFFALQGNCPRCAFDLYRGDLIANDPAFEDLPLPGIACPTCSTTYSMVSGRHGPPIKRTGLAGFVGGLAKTATASDSGKDAEAFQITLDESGRVYCRKKQKGKST